MLIDPAVVDAALFDMDGTLLDSSAAVEGSWTMFAEEYDLDPADVLAAVHGVRAVDSIARWVPADEVDAATRKLIDREMSLTDGIVEIAGAAELLRALADATLPAAIVTSAPRELAIVRLEAAGLPIPTVFVTGDDVDRGKPAPDCYLLAAERIGAEPARCVVFEDAEAGIRAGLAAGARVVVVGGYASDTTAPLERITDYRAVRIS
ncbi:HAD-IA family hydrolase [Pseudolysinimonas sp.]|uniref:HAD-IA family hydrolase n=1 Tax=Pseudolysinimonas sp. TaxID=2680009 RepID=UPI003F7D2EFC